MVKNSFIIFAVAILIRTFYVFFLVDLEYLSVEDQALYIQLAQQIPENGFLGITSERVPGYPLFMSLIYDIFGNSLWNVILIQILLDSFTAVVVAMIANLVFGRGFLIAGILSAVNLSMIVLSASILTDTLFLFLFVVFLFSLLKYQKNTNIKWFLMSVLFISLATLVRPSSYYIIPVLFVFLVVWRMFSGDGYLKIASLSILYLVVISLLFGGIHHRNFQQYKTAQLVYQTGGHILWWVVPATYQYSGKGSYKEGQKIAQDRLKSELQDDNLIDLPLNPFESSAYQANIGKKILTEFGFVSVAKAWTVGSVVNLISPSAAYAPSVRTMEHPSFYETSGNGIFEKIFNYVKNSSGFLYLSILTIGTISSILFVILALLGIYRATFKLPFITMSTLIFLIGYFLVITGPIIGIKYRLPIEPILTIFLAYFLSKSQNIKNFKSD
jgi:4-amino-4-deoxy-L-arabinose transferase-like glycosyltransferase